MPQPALEPGETLITESQNVRVRETAFDARLTNRRILLGQDVDPFLEATGKEFLLTSVKRFRPSADEKGNPTIELVIALPESKEGRLLLHFDQTDSSRENERDRWVGELRHLVDPSVAAPAPAPVQTPPMAAPQQPPAYQQPVIQPAFTPPPAPPQQQWPAPGAAGTICPTCGNQLPPGARFCNRCGHQIPAPPFGQAPPQQPGYPPQAPPVQPSRPVTMADDPGYYQQQPPADSRNRRERTSREKKAKTPRPPKPARTSREPRQKREKAPRQSRRTRQNDPYGDYYGQGGGSGKKKIIIPIVIIAVVAVVAVIAFVFLSGGLPAGTPASSKEPTSTDTGGSDTGTTGGTTPVSPSVTQAPTTSPGNIGIKVFHSGNWSGQYTINGQPYAYSGIMTETIDLGVSSGAITASFKAENGGALFVDIIKFLDETKKKQTTIASGDTPDASGYVTVSATI